MKTDMEYQESGLALENYLKDKTMAMPTEKIARRFEAVEEATDYLTTSANTEFATFRQWRDLKVSAEALLELAEKEMARKLECPDLHGETEI